MKNGFIAADNGNGVAVVSGLFSLPFSSLGTLPQRDRAPLAPRLAEFIGGPENALVRTLPDLLLGAFEAHPLLLCGPTQSGKSHLARGLLAHWKQAWPQSPAVFFTGADFARAYAHAVDEDAIGEFREKCRLARLFVIDDVHQLSGKTAAQHELCHTLDVLAQSQARVLLTAPLPPRELVGMQPALISRLQAGLVAPLRLPGELAREELVRKLAAQRGLVLWPVQVQKLAQRGGATVTELDGALASLTAHAAAEQRPIDDSLVDELLDHKTESRRVQPRTVVEHVAKHFHVRLADLRGPSRKQSIVLARGVAMFLVRKLTGLSLLRTGKEFGNRDHTTVLHACEKIQAARGHDAALAHVLNELEQKICG